MVLESCPGDFRAAVIACGGMLVPPITGAATSGVSASDGGAEMAQRQANRQADRQIDGRIASVWAEMSAFAPGLRALFVLYTACVRPFCNFLFLVFPFADLVWQHGATAAAAGAAGGGGDDGGGGGDRRGGGPTEEAGRHGDNDNDVDEYDLNAIVSRANYLVDVGCKVHIFLGFRFSG